MATASRLLAWLTDRLDEAWLGLSTRRVRTMLTALVVAVGVGGYLAVVGSSMMTQTAVRARLDALRPTEVDAFIDNDDQLPAEQIQDGIAAAARLPGVRGVSALAQLTLDPRPTASLSLRPGHDGRAVVPDVDVQTVEGDIGPSIGTFAHPGRWFDAGHIRRGDRVAVVGSSLADALGLRRVAPGAVVFVGGAPFSILGVAQGLTARRDLRSSLFVPRGAAEAVWGAGRLQRRSFTIRAHRDAVDAIADRTPLALSPDRPESVSVSVPPDPSELRASVDSQLSRLLRMLAVAAFLSGGLAIAAITFAGVLERRVEIGLRKAMGAQRSEVVAQFLIETMAIGLAGGIIGATAGTLALAAMATLRDQQFTFPIEVVMLAPVVGAVLGVVAGLLPAYVASRVEPVRALGASS